MHFGHFNFLQAFLECTVGAMLAGFWVGVIELLTRLLLNVSSNDFDRRNKFRLFSKFVRFLLSSSLLFSIDFDSSSYEDKEDSESSWFLIAVSVVFGLLSESESSSSGIFFVLYRFFNFSTIRLNWIIE